MSILGWVVIGLVAGWLAGKITGRRETWWADIIIGIVGAIVGGFIYGLVTGQNVVAHFNLGTLIVATLGAVIVLFIWGAVRARA